MNIEINWDEVDYQIVAITLNGANTLVGWSSVPRWIEEQKLWYSSDGRGAVKQLEIPYWAKIDAKDSLKMRPTELRFHQSLNGQVVEDRLSGDEVDIAGLDNLQRKDLLDLLNRVDREGR
jgi:hypothetical protein